MTKRRGRYWYFAENLMPGSKPTSEIRLWAALPLTHKGQTVNVEGIYPEPEAILSAESNQLVFWRLPNVPATDQLVFYYDFTVAVQPVLSNIEPDSVTPVDVSSAEYQRYTISEPWLEITPEIQAKAQQIAGTEPNPYRAAKRLFNWVMQTMRYEYPDINDRGAAKSFTRLKGDCGEFSFVFIAMCRALGIPARSVVCVWFDGSGHAWAEIFLAPYGWIPVDTSVANMMLPGMNSPIDAQMVEQFKQTRGIPSNDPSWLFGNLYPNRLIVSLGNNLTVSHNGIERTFRFLQPGGETAFPVAFESEGFDEPVIHGGFYMFDNECTNMETAKKLAEKRLAGNYLAAGFHKKAIDGFKRITADTPQNAQAWLNLGQIYFKLNDFESARHAFIKCIKGQAGSIKPVLEVWARNFLGNCLDAQGDRAGALQEYRAAVDSGVDYQGSRDYAEKFLKEVFTPESKKS